MTRRGLLGIIGLHGLSAQDLGPRSLSTKNDEPGKYYITGEFNGTKNITDCDVPPIIAFGNSRADALLRCCEGGALTVWTEREWNKWRSSGGAAFDKYCEERKKAKAVNAK